MSVLGAHGLPRAATVLLGIGIALQLLAMGRTLLATREVPPLPAARTERRAPKNTALDVNGIVAAHLFGVAEVASSADAGLPASLQSMFLTATFATNDPKRGYAILGDIGQAAQLHASGDPLEGGGRLNAIFRDYVIVERGGSGGGGSLEKVVLRTRAGAGEGEDGRQRSLASRGTARAPPELAAAEDGNSNASVKMSSFQLLPVFGARDSGARVGLVKNPEQFGKTGLTAGDIVMAVNGTPVHDVPSAAEMLRATGGRQLTLTVKRGAQIEDIQVDSLD